MESKLSSKSRSSKDCFLFRSDRRDCLDPDPEVQDGNDPGGGTGRVLRRGLMKGGGMIVLETSLTPVSVVLRFGASPLSSSILAKLSFTKLPSYAVFLLTMDRMLSGSSIGGSSRSSLRLLGPVKRSPGRLNT